MPFFQGSSNFGIHGGEFNEINGDVYRDGRTTNMAASYAVNERGGAPHANRGRGSHNPAQPSSAYPPPTRRSNTAPQPGGPPPASHPHNPGYPPPHASHTHNPGYPPSSYNAGPPASRLPGPGHRPPEDELAAQLQDLALRGHSRRPSVPALHSAYSNPLPTRHDSLQQYPDNGFRSNPAERTNPRHPRGPPPSGHNPPSSRASWHAPDGPSWVPQQQPYPPPANTSQWSALPPGSQPLRSMSMNPPTTSPSHRYGQSPPQTYPINQPPPPRSIPMNQPPMASPSHPINQPPPPRSIPMNQPPMASPSHRHAQSPPQAYPINQSPGPWPGQPSSAPGPPPMSKSLQKQKRKHEHDRDSGYDSSGSDDTARAPSPHGSRSSSGSRHSSSSKSRR